MPGADEPKPPPLRTFGRRKGRPLRAGWDQLLKERLPALSIDLSGNAPLDPRTLFAQPREAIWLEIGFGAGEHLAWQAEHHPAVGFIGAEVFVNGVASLLRHVSERQLDNVRIHADDARPLLERLAPGSIARLFLLFLAESAPQRPPLHPERDPRPSGARAAARRRAARRQRRSGLCRLGFGPLYAPPRLPLDRAAAAGLATATGRLA